MRNFWSTFGFTLLVTYVLYVLIEAPLEALERMMFPNRRSPPAAKDQPQIEPRTDVVEQIDGMDPVEQIDSPTQSDLETSANKTETDLELSN
ncbi:GD17448 [Drosophila simulans]|uniref:GD17448 n=2 Tax=Drosophila simulans TaxID=7240 RepID=B4R7R6_DROSI|nr:GD17448 [Drosophila simulans]